MDLNDKKEEKSYYIFPLEEKHIIFPYGENVSFDIKSISKKICKIGDKTKLKNNNNKIIENRMKRKNIIYNSNKIILNYIIFNLILSIIKIIFCRIKYNIFDLFYFQNSKITLKIRGIGHNDILGNQEKNYFNGIIFLKEVYINGNITDSIKREYNFNQTDNIVELIWDENINNCEFMFFRCYNITEINLSNFNTSRVTSMTSMFNGCHSLTSLNLTNFDTSQVESMYLMFHCCYLMRSIDLSNFNTSKVTNMRSMFNLCTSLTSLNLSNFDTSQVESINNMFYNCPSLISLDLSNFDTSQAISFKNMFANCSLLTSLDLSSFKTSRITTMENMFHGCNNLDYINLINFEETDLTNVSYMFTNIPENVVICINQNLTEKMILPQIKIKTCPVIYCENNWKLKQNKIINNNECIEKCDINSLYKYEYNGRCYENCSYYYYVDNNNIYHCTMEFSCPNEYPKLNEDKNECIKKDIKDIIKDLTNNETEKISRNEEIDYHYNLLQVIEKEFTSENYDTSNLDNGKIEIIETNIVKTTITVLQNEKNNINNNVTTINLGECEYLLRSFYNLSSNETLYMKKIEVVQEGFNIPKVKYDVYSKLSGKNLIKLNLTVCENTKILISISINITENLDILNSSSGYYNDICYTSTSEDGTDITLKDRKAEYINKNKAICQEDCIFSKFNREILKVECLCKVKVSSLSISDMNIDKDKLLENFKDIKNFLNFNILVCYKNLFTKEGIVNNIGCYLILSIILFHIITIFVFSINDFNSLKKKIKLIVFGRNKNQIIDKNEKGNKCKDELNKISIYTKHKNKKRRKIRQKSDNSKIKFNKSFKSKKLKYNE